MNNRETYPGVLRHASAKLCVIDVWNKAISNAECWISWTYKPILKRDNLFWLSVLLSPSCSNNYLPTDNDVIIQPNNTCTLLIPTTGRVVHTSCAWGWGVDQAPHRWTNDNISYEMHLKEHGLTTLETRRLWIDQIEVVKILNGYENIYRNVISRLRKREGLEDMELH